MLNAINVFKLEYFKKNIGSIIILILIFIQIILNIIYLRKNVYEIRKFTFGLISSYFLNLNKIINEIYKMSNQNINNFNNKIKRIINNSNPQKKNKRNKKNNSTSSRNFSKFSSSLISSKINLQIKKYNKLSKNPISITDNITKKKVKKSKGNKHYMKYKEFYEMNYSLPYKKLKKYMKKSFDDMEYEEALNEDKRKFCKMYNDKLRNKHFILNITFEDDKYRPRTLKCIILILSINLYFVINGLFYSESYIGELYQINEKENFFSFIPRSIERIIYASIVSVIVNFLINFIIINGNKIKYILNKLDNDKKIIKGEITKILFNIERSINIFYIINYFIMIISWYYISCFNNVYSNTKIEWIKSSIFIIIIMQIMPFIFSLVIALLRFISIYYNSEKIYKIIAGLS